MFTKWLIIFSDLKDSILINYLVENEKVKKERC